jgi:hypothetical protein
MVVEAVVTRRGSGYGGDGVYSRWPFVVVVPIYVGKYSSVEQKKVEKKTYLVMCLEPCSFVIASSVVPSPGVTEAVAWSKKASSWCCVCVVSVNIEKDEKKKDKVNRCSLAT